MTIQAIGETSYIVVITEEELNRNNLSVKEISKIDAEKLYELTMAAPIRNGMRACLEVFTGKNELMVFVRYGGERIIAVCFNNFEELLAAARFCPEMSGSELLFDGNQYILVLNPWDSDRVPDSIYEFGEEITVSQDYLSWLREHCTRIIPEKAIETLMRVF